MQKLKGVYSALFSVYDENLNVKKDTVKKLVEYHLANGLKGFYVGGATGECVVLPAKTRKQMLETAVDANNGRGKIIAHIGAGHFDETLDLLDHANNMEIDAISSLPPSLMGYYRADEVVEYYKVLAEKSKHPVYVYINPFVASVVGGGLLDFADKMAQIDNVAGMKISIADYYTFGKVTDAFGDRLNILNGPDECMICGLSVGADGAIGSTYNIVPKLAAEIYDKFKANDMAGALAAQRKMNKIVSILISGNISVWKNALEFLGFDMGYTVFPAKLNTKEEKEKLKSDLDAIGFFDMM